MPKSDLTAIRNQWEEIINSHFFVENEDGHTTVVIESRGGRINAPNERNTQYLLGVDLVLMRLMLLGCILEDAVVDTQQTAAIGLTRAQRRLLTGRFPIILADFPAADLIELRSALCAAQRPIGRRPNARGVGNNTRRMRLYIRGLPDDVNEAAHMLSTGFFL